MRDSAGITPDFASSHGATRHTRAACGRYTTPDHAALDGTLPRMSFDPSPHASRRDDFAELLRGGIAVIPAASEVTRNFDVEYEFRQDSDFWFLTGSPKPVTTGSH